METFNSCLLGVPIFKDLDMDNLIAITKLIQPLNLKKNEDLYQEGDVNSNLYILHKGSLKVYDLSEDGRIQIVRVLHEGDFIGETALFNKTEMQDYVGAIEDSHVCVINGESLVKLIENSSTLSIKLIQALVQRLETLEEKVVMNTSLPTRERILQTIQAMADHRGEIHLLTSKKDFASTLGMAQETLSRQLKALQDEGIIEMKGQRTIIIL